MYRYQAWWRGKFSAKHPDIPKARDFAKFTLGSNCVGPEYASPCFFIDNHDDYHSDSRDDRGSDNDNAHHSGSHDDQRRGGNHDAHRSRNHDAHRGILWLE